MTLTKMHFVALAKIIAGIEQNGKENHLKNCMKYNNLVEDLISWCKSENGRFKESRFREAAQLEF